MTLSLSPARSGESAPARAPFSYGPYRRAAHVRRHY